VPLNPELRSDLAQIANLNWFAPSWNSVSRRRQRSGRRGASRVGATGNQLAHLDALRAAVLERAPGANVVVRTMDDAERLALRNFLRGAMKMTLKREITITATRRRAFSTDFPRLECSASPPAKRSGKSRSR